jgi:hypothetical protein
MNNRRLSVNPSDTVPKEPFHYQIACGEELAPKKGKETIVDYSEHSTTHGIFYIFERGGSTLSHIFWQVQQRLVPINEKLLSF